MTELDWPPVAPDAMALERKPRLHRHAYHRQKDGAWLCFLHAEPVIRDELAARRGKSSRRLGGDGERRSEKRYGWRKVGEFGGIDDLVGTLAIVQQKTSRRAAPVAWKSILTALEGRAAGRVPLLLLSFVAAGKDTEDFIVVRGRDWLALHGKDEPA